VVGEVTGHDHLDNRLSDTPVLSLTQEFKHVVLRVKQKFESDGAVMIFEHTLIIISDGLCVSHGD